MVGVPRIGLSGPSRPVLGAVPGVNALQNLPERVPVEDPPEGYFLCGPLRWVRTTDSGEHESLRADLAEHFLQDRAALLLPYVG